MKNIFLNINATRLVAIMLFLFLSTSFPAAQPGQAQEKAAVDENSTLKDLLAAAALNNPGLKAAFHRWRAAVERIPQVRALPNPQLTFAYFIREVETRVGPQQGKVGIMQMFPWFGKRALKGGAALEAANAAKQVYENTKLKLFYRVKRAYFQYYYMVQTTAVLKENVRLLELLEKVTREKYRTGMASYADLLKIQVEKDKLHDRLSSANEGLEPIKAGLNAALNRAPGSPLPVPEGIPTGTQTREISRDRLVKLLKKNNPQLKAADFTAAKERAGVRLAKKNYYPDFSLGVDYVITGKTMMPGVPGSGKDPVIAAVSFRLPLRFKKNRAAVKGANARFRAAVNRKKEEENSLLARLEMVFYRFRDARRKMVLYGDSLLPRAKQALEVTRSAFEAGEVDFLDFIDSQRTLLGFELAYEEAKTLRAQRLAELQMLVGKEQLSG